MQKSLEEIFSGSIDPDDSEEAEDLFEERAGVQIAAARELTTEIVGDLDPKMFGIGWWAPTLDDKRRIFISDYLFQCASSVSTNLVEASLHLEQAHIAHEAVSARMAHSIMVRQVGRGAFAVEGMEVPKPTSLVDLLPQKLADLHISGFFRAVGSTLDTFAGVCIGVGGLETSIIRADFGRLCGYLERAFPSTPGGLLQQKIKDTITSAVQRAGPNGWLPWALGFRNMLVHRGRRTQFHNVTSDRGPVLYSSAEVPIPRARIVMHLARDPRNTDVQAFFATPAEPSRLTNVLEEDGFQALRHALDAVIFVVKESAGTLLEVWRQRRTTPSLLAQPREQWPDLAIQPDRFTGFEPGTSPVSPDSMYASPTTLRRLTAAAVDSTNRHRWRTFTG